jgi:uncharacterized protein (DUF2126 family)
MGGEPTFVATADRDAAEWNTDALGPTKRGYATELVHKLRAEYGQAASCTSARASGTPASSCRAGRCRSAGAPTASPAGATRRCSPTSATRTATPARTRSASSTLAGKLGVTDQYIQPGYEDVFYYLWRERKLPVNVDPFDTRLDDELERARLRRVFEQKLDAVVGYVLPLKPAGEDNPRSGPAGPPAPGSCATTACT